MAISNLHTLISLFKESDSNPSLPLNKIEIPIIQRDYAQGRNSREVNRIREGFLSALYNALTQEKPIKLDFIYGDINKRTKVLTPLDGQQRLTTLFLLHWYIARHEQVDCDDFSFLKNFSYRTRYSARDFCQRLIDYAPDFSKVKLSEDIEDQSWMPIDWKSDPTISAMLNMLDAIHVLFKETSGLWERLKSGCISFYFLAINDMGLTDELYIKMNSRGKPLTEFEHFKAIWEGYIRDFSTEGSETAYVISKKIDLDWTDMLWPYKGANNIIDDEFVKYYCYLCSIIFYKKYPDERPEENVDALKLTKILFKDKVSDAAENLKFIEKSFDLLCGRDIKELFGRFLTNEQHVSGKSSISEPVDVFEDCCSHFGDMKNARVRSFPIGRMILLYCFLLYLNNENTIDDTAFARRLRIVNNMIKASEFELRDDRMKALLEQTEEIILHGEIIIKEGRLSFNALQVQEEFDKEEWLKSHHDKQEILFYLEDHPLLNGGIRVIGLDNIDYTDRFYSLFKCDKGLVNRALLTIGDYSVKINWRYQVGSATNDNSWRAIFHTKESSSYIHNILLQLLKMNESFSNDNLENIIKNYLSNTNCFDWRYYLIKYNSMRPERYGMYYWYDHKEREKSSYRILMMLTEKSIGGTNYNVFLKTLYDEIEEGKAYLGHYAYAGDGNRLEIGDNAITCEDNCFYIFNKETNEEIKKVDIPQKESIDIEDRIEIGRRVVNDIMDGKI